MALSIEMVKSFKFIFTALLTNQIKAFIGTFCLSIQILSQ
jgi:hypothetical protein